LEHIEKNLIGKITKKCDAKQPFFSPSQDEVIKSRRVGRSIGEL